VMNASPVEHFLFPFPTEPPTLMNVISDWIEHGTTLISDCCAEYRDIGSLVYTHRAVNHSISFVSPDTADQTNHIECTWRHVKAFLWPYHPREDYEFHLIHYMFAARCKAQEVPQFTQFFAIIASTDWASCTTTATSGSDATWLPTVDLRSTTASHDSGMRAHSPLTELLPPCFTFRLYNSRK
jgi:hypothetical protein